MYMYISRCRGAFAPLRRAVCWTRAGAARGQKTISTNVLPYCAEPKETIARGYNVMFILT